MMMRHDLEIVIPGFGISHWVVRGQMALVSPGVYQLHLMLYSAAFRSSTIAKAMYLSGRIGV